MIRYLINIALMLSMVLCMGALPSDMTEPTDTQNPQQNSIQGHPACEFVHGVISIINHSDPDLTMRVVSCNVVPKPMDSLAFYLVEVIELRNNKPIYYKLIIGDIIPALGGAAWKLGVQPAPVVIIPLEPPVEKKPLDL